MRVQAAAERVRSRVGASIFERVAGAQGPGHRRTIHGAPGERWFAADRPVRRVHGDSAMFVGGIRALLLQSLHPLAMAGVAALPGTAGTLGGGCSAPVTSWRHDVRPGRRRQGGHPAGPGGPRARHRHRAGRAAVRGLGPAPADLDSHRRGRQLPARPQPVRRPAAGPGRARRLRADMARIGAELGVPDPPRTEAELADRIRQYRPSCAAPPRPGRPPGSCCSARRCRSSRGRRTECSPPRRPHCCPGGRAARCTCRGCRSPRPPWSGPPATPSSTPSAGPSPRPPRRRPAEAARPDPVQAGREPQRMIATRFSAADPRA